MATNATRSQQTMSGGAAHTAAMAQDVAARRKEAVSGLATESLKHSGYGLPCAKCRLYYPADLDVCPTCHHNQRVSAVVPKVSTKAASPTAEVVPDTTLVEQEREDFLRQFKSQLREAHAEAVDMPEAACSLREHHADESAGAEVCKACYERIQERLEVCEAALHIDLKEAAQIIYDAVWADPSDPNLTYQNAANALLTELRKRAGINALRAPFQPLAD